MGWVVNATPRPLLPRERSGTHCTGAWVSPRAGLDRCGKSRPTTGIRSPDRPVRSESLYRLSYPSLTVKWSSLEISSLRSHPLWGKCGVIGSFLFEKTIRRLKAYTDIYVNTQQMLFNTQKKVHTMRIKDEIRLLYKKKQKLNNDLYKTHLKAAQEWGNSWYTIL